METVNDILRRVSLNSQGLNDKKKSLEEQKIKEINKGPEPVDKFYFLYVLFFLVGLLQWLPATFFVTANAYWMYKFRNITQEEADSNNRSELQAIFASWTSIVSSIPMMICSTLSTFYGHKIKLRSRFLLTLSFVVSCFILFTGFIKINTDSWQTLFFIMTMLGIVLINGTMSLFQASSMVLLSRFPPKYARPYLFGDSFSGIFNPLMQIISLAIGSSVQVAALIYFLAGTSVLGVTLCLLVLSKYNSLFQYHMNNTYDDSKRPVFKLSEIKDVAIQIWPCLAICSLFILTLLPTHPSVTALVVSENYGNGDPWSDKYFVPVVTFFLTGVCMLLGRITAGTLTLNKSNSAAWVGLMTLRMFVFVPLIVLCNALPRHNFPVVFTHDWEYILIMICFNFTAGFTLTIMFLGIPVLAPGKQEIAYLSMMTLMSMLGAISSPLGLVIVKIL